MEQINTTLAAAPAPPAERDADSAEKVFHDIVTAADLPGGQKTANVIQQVDSATNLDLSREAKLA